MHSIAKDRLLTRRQQFTSFFRCKPQSACKFFDYIADSHLTLG